MSKKAVVLAALYTGFLPSLFISIYQLIGIATKSGVLPDGVAPVWNMVMPWMMFPFMAMFFLMGQAPKKVWWFFLTVVIGIFWGWMCIKLLFFFTPIFGQIWGGFVGIGIGMFITLFVHMGPLGNTPINSIPAIFLGVSLGFSQLFASQLMPPQYVSGMIFTFFMGAVLAILCMIGQGLIMKKFPPKGAPKPEQEA